MPRRFGIVGAGMAGLAAGRALAARGHAVRLLDKGRAPGGRVATRRAGEGGALRFDHGAQYIRAEDPGLARLLREAGARPWPDPARLVGMPSMSALPRALAEGLDIRCGFEATALARAPEGWWVEGAPGEERREGPFDAVLVTAPAPQARRLLPHPFAEPLARIRYAPCWTVMAAFPERLDLPDTLRPEAGHPIGWAARDSSKPGRDAAGPDCWVVQAGPGFSRARLEETAEAVAPLLLAEFAALAAGAGAAPPPAPRHLAAHRWRYSLLEQPLGQPCLWDGALGLGHASDGCLGGRVEAAWLSGLALAEAAG